MSMTGRDTAKFRGTMWVGFATMLVLPLIAMRFTSEVKWDAADFLAAATLLVALGTAVELIVRFVAKVPTQTVLIVGALACVLLVWADAAVGIFE